MRREPQPDTACPVTEDLAERRRASARAKAAMEDEPAARAVRAIVDEINAVAARAAVAGSGG